MPSPEKRHTPGSHLVQLASVEAKYVGLTLALTQQAFFVRLRHVFVQLIVPVEARVAVGAQGMALEAKAVALLVMFGQLGARKERL